MSIRTLPIVCLLLVAPGCGGNAAAPPPNPAPTPSAAPPVAEYKSAFEKGTADKWTPLYGNWWVKGKAYQQDNDKLQGTKSMLDLPDSDCYTLQFTARPFAGVSGAIGAIVKYQKKYVWWNIGGEGEVVGLENPSETNRGYSGLKVNTPYLVKVIVDHDRLTGWLNGAQRWSVRRTPEQVQGLKGEWSKDLVGLAGLGTEQTSVQFSNVEVTPKCK